MILNAIRQLTADLLPVHKTLRGAEVWMRVSTYVLNPLLTHTTQAKEKQSVKIVYGIIEIEYLFRLICDKGNCDVMSNKIKLCRPKT